MTVANFGEVVPQKGDITEAETELYAQLDDNIKAYYAHMDGLEFRKAMSDLREILVAGNNYLAKTEPWKAAKTDLSRAGTILYTALNLIRLYAKLLAPIMPATTDRMNSVLNIENTPVWTPAKMAEELQILISGHNINQSEPLFQKIMPERVEELRQKYKETE